MDARDLKVFEAVARLGRMGAAAAELNTVQSNITGHIRRLEEELGVPLFERHARGVKLASAGDRLLPYARRIAGLLNEATRAARDSGVPAGPLTIGTLETTAAMRLSPILHEYMARYPAVDLTLRSGTTSELVSQIRADALDGAFVCGPIASPEFTTISVFTEQLALLSAPHLGSVDAVLAQCQELRIVVLRRGCSYRQRLEEFLARRGLPVTRVLEFGTLEAILGCVAAGLGVTLLPVTLIEMHRQAGCIAVHAPPPDTAQVETVFIHRREAYVSSALRSFLDLVVRMTEAQDQANTPTSPPWRRAANQS